MKIIFDHIKLRQGLKRVASAVNNKSILPALSNIQLQVNGNSCTLTTTDLSAYMQTLCDCEATGSFNVLLPFAELQKISMVVAGPMIITVDDKKKTATIESGTDVFKMGIEASPDIFPNMPGFEETAGFDLQPDTLELLTKMALVTKTDTQGIDTRFEHICFDCKPGAAVVIYATDLFRAVRCNTDLKTEADCRLPLHKNHTKLLREIGACRFSFNDRWIKAVGINVTALLLRGEVQWPDGSVLFANHNAFNVEANRSDLESALQKVQVYNVELPQLKLKFGIADDVPIEFADDAYGYAMNSSMKATQHLDAVAYTLNAKLLPELMNCLPQQDEIDMQVLTNGTKLFMGSKTNPEVLCAIMPIVQN